MAGPGFRLWQGVGMVDDNIKTIREALDEYHASLREGITQRYADEMYTDARAALDSLESELASLRTHLDEARVMRDEERRARLAPADSPPLGADKLREAIDAIRPRPCDGLPANVLILRQHLAIVCAAALRQAAKEAQGRALEAYAKEAKSLDGDLVWQLYTRIEKEGPL